jgi:hypothetical protein
MTAEGQTMTVAEISATATITTYSSSAINASGYCGIAVPQKYWSKNGL